MFPFWLIGYLVAYGLCARQRNGIDLWKRLLTNFGHYMDVLVFGTQ